MKVHQNILCTQSTMLKGLREQVRQVSYWHNVAFASKLLTAELKYTSLWLHFAEYDLATVFRVLCYLYTGDYDDETLPIIGPSVAPALGRITNRANSTTHCQNDRPGIDHRSSSWLTSLKRTSQLNLKVLHHH